MDSILTRNVTFSSPHRLAFISRSTAYLRCMMEADATYKGQLWIGTDKHACVDRSGQPPGSPLGRYPRLRLVSGQTKAAYTELTHHIIY
jgi:hypothetical protein